MNAQEEVRIRLQVDSHNDLVSDLKKRIRQYLRKTTRLTDEQRSTMARTAAMQAVYELDSIPKELRK